MRELFENASDTVAEQLQYFEMSLDIVLSDTADENVLCSSEYHAAAEVYSVSSSVCVTIVLTVATPLIGVGSGVGVERRARRREPGVGATVGSLADVKLST